MEIVKQVKSDRHSGQCCLATITGNRIIHVFEHVGTKHRTTTNDLVKYLDLCGIENSGKLVVVGKAGKNQLPHRGILKVTFFDRFGEKINSKWAVIYYPKILDPEIGEMKVTDYLVNIQGMKGRITSFLKVKI